VGDVDGAEGAYRRGTRADANAAENWLGLATVGLVRKDYAAALAAYEAVLARRPTYADAELGRAFSLAKLGRVAEAEKALERAEALGASKAHVEKQRRALR
jgi:tetratricopeptide (TPR) repeat protein